MESTTNPYESPRSDRPAPTEVRIRIYQPLPPVCVLCGAVSTTKKSVPFEVRSGSRESEQLAILLPLCHRHRFFRWGWPYVGQAASMLLGVMASLLAGSLPLAQLQVTGLLLAGSLLVACPWAWYTLQSRRVRASRYEGGTVLLSGVDPQFAAGCQTIDQQERKHVEDFLDSIG